MEATTSKLRTSALARNALNGLMKTFTRRIGSGRALLDATGRVDRDLTLKAGLGEALESVTKQKWEDADKQFDLAIFRAKRIHTTENHESNAAAYMYKGIFLRGRTRWAESEAALKRAVDIYSELPCPSKDFLRLAYSTLGLVLLAREHWDEAEKVFHKAILKEHQQADEESPETVFTVYALLGKSHLRQGRWDDAIASFNHATDASPDNRLASSATGLAKYATLKASGRPLNKKGCIHGLQRFKQTKEQIGRYCDGCWKVFGTGTTVHGCSSCDIDMCSSCFRRACKAGR
jgi:tetratricopeptide (TPR) repeat protein